MRTRGGCVEPLGNYSPSASGLELSRELRCIGWVVSETDARAFHESALATARGNESSARRIRPIRAGYSDSLFSVLGTVSRDQTRPPMLTISQIRRNSADAHLAAATHYAAAEYHHIEAARDCDQGLFEAAKAHGIAAASHGERARDLMNGGPPRWDRSH